MNESEVGVRRPAETSVSGIADALIDSTKPLAEVTAAYGQTLKAASEATKGMRDVAARVEAASRVARRAVDPELVASVQRAAEAASKAVAPLAAQAAAISESLKPQMEAMRRLQRTVATQAEAMYKARAEASLRGEALRPERGPRERAPRRTARVRRPQRQRAPTGDPPRHTDRLARCARPRGLP